MDNNVKHMLNEEINNVVKKMKLNSTDEVVNVIHELFSLNPDKLISNIGSVEGDNKNHIAQENWDWFLDTLKESIEELPHEWVKSLTLVKSKILTYKYFTRKELIGVDNLESYLRINIKPYFSALQNFTDMDDFKNKFFGLPTEILYCLVRYMFVLSPELKQSIKITNEDLKSRINKAVDLRMKVAEKISQISNGYQDVFDLNEVKELYDNGVLFEDNFINRAISEFVCKLLNNTESQLTLREIFSSSMIKDMKRQAEMTAAYTAHIAGIKDGNGQEYFKEKGMQIGKRFDNEIEMVRENNFEGYVIQDGSRLKEPNERINPVTPPWEGGGMDAAGNPVGPDGSGGGSSFGGGPGMGGIGNADFGGDFAPPGMEGEVPGDETGVEEDGVPMPDGEDGLPADFGSVEDNTDEDTPEASEEK